MIPVDPVLGRRQRTALSVSYACLDSVSCPNFEKNCLVSVCLVFLLSRFCLLSGFCPDFWKTAVSGLSVRPDKDETEVSGLSVSLSADVQSSDDILDGNLNWMVQQFTKVKTWWVSIFFLKLPLEILIFSNYQYQYIIISYLNGLIELKTYSITIFRFQPGQLNVSTISLSCLTSLCFR